MEIANDKRRAVVRKKLSGFTVSRWRMANRGGWQYLAVGRENFKKEETAIKQGQKWVDKAEF